MFAPFFNGQKFEKRRGEGRQRESQGKAPEAPEAADDGSSRLTEMTADRERTVRRRDGSGLEAGQTVSDSEDVRRNI